MNEQDNMAYWRRQAERYFDCTLTDEEERQLKSFVAHSDSPAFDDVRAVMGYAAVARRQAARPSANLRRRWVGAAAALVLILGMTLLLRWSNPDCVAYVNGQRITDRQQVVRLMHSTMQQVALDDSPAKATMASQLTDMFESMNNNE